MGNEWEIQWKINGKWIWNLMDEQTDFIMEMKMGTLIGNEFEKRFDYNEWMMGYKNLIW